MEQATFSPYLSDSWNPQVQSPSRGCSQPALIALAADVDSRISLLRYRPLAVQLRCSRSHQKAGTNTGFEQCKVRSEMMKPPMPIMMMLSIKRTASPKLSQAVLRLASISVRCSHARCRSSRSPAVSPRSHASVSVSCTRSHIGRVAATSTDFGASSCDQRPSSQLTRESCAAKNECCNAFRVLVCEARQQCSSKGGLTSTTVCR